MSRCGCAGSTACACAVQPAPGSGITITGNGSAQSPYQIGITPDSDPDNLLTNGPNGLLVNCAAVVECVSAGTPAGFTTVTDSPGVNFTLTGTGTAGDPYVISADLTAVSVQSAAQSFLHPLDGPELVWEEINELPGLVITVPGTYVVTFTARAQVVIPEVTTVTNVGVAARLHVNGAPVPATETTLDLLSQGEATTIEAPLQTHTSGTTSVVVTLAAGDVLTLAGQWFGTPDTTQSILSNAQGRTRITAHRIGA